MQTNISEPLFNDQSTSTTDISVKTLTSIIFLRLLYLLCTYYKRESNKLLVRKEMGLHFTNEIKYVSLYFIPIFLLTGKIT